MTQQRCRSPTDLRASFCTRGQRLNTGGMKMKSGLRSIAASAAAAALIAGSGMAFAQSYPIDNVTLVTHSAAGGGTDVFLREMNKYLSKHMGTNFVVENVRGGSGAKAMAKLATAPADGSIFYGTTPTFINTRSEEHTSELQSLMRNSYAVFCLKKKNNTTT